MKKFATLMVIVVAVVFSAGFVVGADAPEKVTVKAIQKSKPPVVFNHKAHGERAKGDCQSCHHKDEKGKEQGCASCHKPKMDKEKESFKEVMHTKCKGCHTKEKKGPTKCDDCHKKA